MVSSSGTGSSILLGLASSGIGNEERAVVLEKELLDFSFLGFVDILLVVCNNSLGKRLSDGVDLGNVASAAHANADVKILESLEILIRNNLGINDIFVEVIEEIVEIVPKSRSHTCNPDPKVLPTILVIVISWQ